MITIEADNYDEAIKEARKQKRQAKKQEAIDKVDRDISYEKAYAALGRMAYMLLDETISCHFWDQGARTRPGDREHSLICRFDSGDGHWGETEFYRTQPVRTLLDGGGWILAVMVQEETEVCWYAVGVHNGKVALVGIPNWLAEMVDNHLAEQAQKQIA